MGGTHNIKINISDALVECVLRIEDFSVYEPLLPYSGASLQIQLPGFNECVEFTTTTTPALEQGFVLNLNACMLNIQTDNCGLQQYPLPDGIYTIQYSVAPNNVLYDEKYHLRDVKAQILLKKIYASLNLGPCEPDFETKQKFDLLNTIDGYLKAAKALVEIDGDCKKGMMMYNYAYELLGKLTCKTC
jgi:hypothetical protein